MTKKHIALFLTLIVLAGSFTACKKEETPAPETATQSSDTESATIHNSFEHVDEQVSIAGSTSSVSSSKDFDKNIMDPQRKSVAYYGAEDIVIKSEEYINKTLSIKTIGKLTLDSAVYSVVVEEAGKGVAVNAKADSIILHGDNLNTEITAETGNIYIEGKNAVVTISAGTVQYIYIRNVTAVIVNNSDSAVTVILTNGTKVIVDAAHTYNVKTNEITQNTSA